MAKSARKPAEKSGSSKTPDQSFINVGQNAFDPSLTSLFASSSGPVRPPPKSRYQALLEKTQAEESSEDEIEEDEDSSKSSASEESDNEVESEDELGNEAESGSDSTDEESASSSSREKEDDVEMDSDSEDGEENETVLAKLRESVLNGDQDRPNKKRKRTDKGEVEDVYLQKLAREEMKEEEKRKKKQKTEIHDHESSQSDDSDTESFTIPVHESLVEQKEGDKQELEKASRTVFLGNVSSEAITSTSAKKTLMRHLASFIDDLADNDPPHKVESLRFRSTAFASALPKKAAFAKKEVMDATTKSTNAYAVYSTQLAAREASKRLNGTVVLNRHLRVDWVAHPSPTDHRRCVFVGNLGFVDDESKLNADEEGKKKKQKPPGDVEEGLWVQFSKAGKVENVRVVRDSKTRVGKGFAYVQFEDENGVEAALQYNEQKFPPLLPRKLRVVRAKAPRKKPSTSAPKPTIPKSKGVYNAKVSNEQKSKQGRARAMLGKAGAFKSAESFVFEGHRASSKQGTSGLKLGSRNKGKGGKPQNRGSKRAAAWKKSGGKR